MTGRVIRKRNAVPAISARRSKAARAFDWEKPVGGNAMLAYEPVGVCVLITPWNLPMNQIAAKVGPALVAGCRMALKPNEVAAPSVQLFVEFGDEAMAIARRDPGTSSVPDGGKKSAPLRRHERKLPSMQTILSFALCKRH